MAGTISIGCQNFETIRKEGTDRTGMIKTVSVADKGELIKG